MENGARITWITGASSGIGRALAEAFVRHGDLVVGTARDEAKLADVKSRLGTSSDRYVTLACDVRQEEAVESTVRTILDRYRKIDVLINSAGVTYFKDFLSTTPTEFDHVVDTNLKGTFLVTRSVLPSMLERHQGVIVNIVSYAAKASYTLSSAYAASKAGVEALMGGLRAEVREKGIKIVNVFPGAVLTPIWNPKHRERYADRMMKPEELAEPVYELTCLPASMMAEELIVRPQAGDLKV
jgi:3-oxoacyl-[acyl-carrier protein] reductase